MHRYSLRPTKERQERAFQSVQPENIIAVTSGHSKEVEQGIIESLRDLKISANAKQDKGQKPPYIKMEGEVYYYLTQKHSANDGNWNFLLSIDLLFDKLLLFGQKIVCSSKTFHTFSMSLSALRAWPSSF